MKTLKEIAAAIDALPVTAFKDTYGSSTEVKLALERGWKRWQDSGERIVADAAEEVAREERRDRDAAKARERYTNVKKWLKDGTLKPGVFVKVTGARDGHGIREYVSHDERTIHCRQWIPVRFGRTELVNPDKLRTQGYLKIADMWIYPETQMTTHEYDKVVKIL